MQLNNIKNLKQNKKYYKIVAQIKSTKDKLKELEELDLAEIVIFDGVGAEMFAKHAFDFADQLITEQTEGRCFVKSVECMEHGANSAIYERPGIQD